MAPLGSRAAKGAKQLLSHAKDKPTKTAVKALISRALARPQADVPKIRCVCGSGALYSECHGHEDGVPLHPRNLCPCENNRQRSSDRGSKNAKTYARCCLKQRHYIRCAPARCTLRPHSPNPSTANSTQSPRTPATRPAPRPTRERIRRDEEGKWGVCWECPPRFMTEEAGKTLMAMKLAGKTGPIMPGRDDEERVENYRKLRRRMYQAALSPLVNAGQVDEAYYAAVMVCDFGKVLGDRKSTDPEHRRHRRHWRRSPAPPIVTGTPGHWPTSPLQHDPTRLPPATSSGPARPWRFLGSSMPKVSGGGVYCFDFLVPPARF